MSALKSNARYHIGLSSQLKSKVLSRRTKTILKVFHLSRSAFRTVNYVTGTEYAVTGNGYGVIENGYEVMMLQKPHFMIPDIWYMLPEPDMGLWDDIIGSGNYNAGTGYGVTGTGDE